MSVHIIAEAGSNYNGSVAMAKKLNAAAACAAADSVKYQIINTDQLYRPGEYSYGTYRIEDVRAIRRRDELSVDSWKEIFADAVERGIAVSASVFDEGGLELLDSFDPPYIKIASCDLNNHRLLRAVASCGRKMVVSTGMSTIDEIEATVDVLKRSGISGSDLVLLHCVSAYPSPLSETNLRFIETLGKRTANGFKGFSAHDDRVSKSLFFKKFKIFRYMPRKRTCATNDSVCCCGYDMRNSDHTDTSALIWGCGSYPRS